MNKMIEKKFATLQSIMTNYEQYNGECPKNTYEGIKRYILLALANTRLVSVDFKVLETKFAPFEDLDK